VLLHPQTSMMWSTIRSILEDFNSAHDFGSLPNQQRGDEVIPDKRWLSMSTDHQNKIYRYLYERPWLLAGVYFLLFAVSLELAHPYYFLNDDNVTGSLPQLVHNYRSLSRGEVPLFNFFQYLGIPHLSQGQTMALYPPAYLSVLLSQVFTGAPWAAIDIFVIGHLTIAAAVMVRLLRLLQVNAGCAFLAGISWSTCSFLIYVGNSWINVSTAACYIPLSLYCQAHLLGNFTLRGLVSSSIIRSLFIFTGHVQFVLYASVCEAVFLLLAKVRFTSTTKSIVLRLGVSHVLAVIWSLGLLLPMFSLAGESIRGVALSFDEFASRRLEPLDLLCGIFLPICSSGGIPGSFDSISYGGVLPPLVVGYLLFKLLGLQAQAANCRMLRLSTAFLALSMIVVIPEGFIGRTLHAPEAVARAIYCFQVIPSVSIFRHLHKKVVSKSIWMVDLTLLVCFLFGMAYRLDFAQLLYMLPVVNRFRWPFKWMLFSTFYSILVASLGTTLIVPLHDKRHRKLMVLVGTMVTTVFVVQIYFFRPPESFLKLTETAALLDAPVVLPGRGRAASMVYEYKRINPALIGFNFATLREVPYLGGYSPIVPATAYELSLYSNYFSSFQCPQISEPGLEHLLRWGVRWLLVDKQCSILNEIVKIRGSHERFNLYELPAEPMIHLSRSNKSEIVPLMHTNYLELPIDSDEDEILTLAYRAQKNLQVFVDSAGPLTEIKDPYGRISVAVPSGKHVVTVRYREPLFEVGVCISLAVAGAGVVGRYSRLARNLSLSGRLLFS
jgi:hypothetical protein